METRNWSLANLKLFTTRPLMDRPLMDQLASLQIRLLMNWLQNRLKSSLQQRQRLHRPLKLSPSHGGLQLRRRPRRKSRGSACPSFR